MNRSSIRNASTMRRRILVAASFLLAVHGFARQEGAPAERGYEILSHQAKLQLVPGVNFVRCTDTLSIRRTNRKSDKLELGLLRLYEVEQLSVNGTLHSMTRMRDGIILEDIPGDSIFYLTITYTGTFPERTEYSVFSSTHATVREEEVLPFGPKAYRFTRLTIAVPADWSAMAVGSSLPTTISEDTATTVWELRQPIPLIGWICAGKYIREEFSNGRVSIATYRYPEDSLSGGNYLRLADSVLTYYSERFSPYRFSNLNIVEVDDEIAGKSLLAIAEPSLIMVKQLGFMTEDKFNQVDAVLPHEIAHQWWPITVFVDDQDVALLSEGMCEYSAMMYHEFAGSPGKRDSLKTHPLLGPLISRVIKGEDLPLQMRADLRSLPTHYLKSAFVHNMLRRELGDSVFSELYRQYAKRFALHEATLKDFQSLAEELSGKKLSIFFDQWVKQKGVPRMKVYNVKSSRLKEGWMTRGRVRMLGYEKFSTFVDVGVVTKAGVSRQRVNLGVDTGGVYHNDVSFEITTKEKPLRAVLDPDGDILKIQKLPVKLGDLRDPADGIMIVGTQRDHDYLLELARQDSRTMERAGWLIRIMDDSSITLADLQRDKVFLYGNVSENSVANDLQEKFRIAMKGDSIIVNGESIVDSTLTLMQAIESPFRPQGIVVWIAPVSTKARSALMPYNASWMIMREKKEISSGIWEVKDGDLEVEIK